MFIDTSINLLPPSIEEGEKKMTSVYFIYDLLAHIRMQSPLEVENEVQHTGEEGKMFPLTFLPARFSSPLPFFLLPMLCRPSPPPPTHPSFLPSLFFIFIGF